MSKQSKPTFRRCCVVVMPGCLIVCVYDSRKKFGIAVVMPNRLIVCVYDSRKGLGIAVVKRPR